MVRDELGRRAPRFLIIGAAKCGTTYVSKALAARPDLYLVTSEPRAFLSDTPSPVETTEYINSFARCHVSQVPGELNNRYSMGCVYGGTAGRLAAQFPDAKIIYLVRDPIARTESWWMQKRRNGDPVHYDFSTALRRSPELLVDTSDYWTETQRFLHCFPHENFLVVFAEDLLAEPRTEIERILDFIGVPAGNLDLPAPDTGNPSAKALAPAASLDMVRALPLTRIASKPLPPRVRAWLKHVFFLRRLRSRPAWDPETRLWVVQRLGPNARRFLEYAGRSQELWPWVAEVS